MNAAGQTICLSMIVKNESAVIRRCLDSVRPLIDCWVIVDTGSTDGTQDIIRDHLSGLPGALHERPWRDFAYNRTEALELARGKAEYTFVIDADDTLEISSDRSVAALTADCYMIEIRDAVLSYERIQLMRSALPWRYEGVLHEYPTCDDAGSPEHLSGIRMIRNHDGARRRDPKTYWRDVEVLESAILTEHRPFLRARYRFYLAQSYRDCGQWDKSLENYLARAELGFWQEEVFISLYFAAQLKERLGHPVREIIEAYQRASDALPTRAEALHGASRVCRQAGQYEDAYQLAKRGLQLSPPQGALFVEPWIYETGLLDEFSVSAYWSGRYRESLDASLRLLEAGTLGAADLRRVAGNAKFASERLPPDPNLSRFGDQGFVEQHASASTAPLQAPASASRRVLLAILAEQKAAFLPLYLRCIEDLDYPKSSIVLYVHAGKDTDGTARVLQDWLERVGHLYAGVEFDTEDVDATIETLAVHERDPARFNALASKRNSSLKRAVAHKCDFYFVADADNFVRPATLRELAALNLPIAAPFLRTVDPSQLYSNYHADVDEFGYYKPCDQYFWALNRWVRGVIEVPVVHCTYLIRSDVIERLTYQDGSDRHEYVIFAESARRSGVPMYLDNRQIYGYVAFPEGHVLYGPNDIERASELLGARRPPERFREGAAA